MIQRYVLFWWHGHNGSSPTYNPSLDFSDARNSQYYVMGWP